MSETNSVLQRMQQISNYLAEEGFRPEIVEDTSLKLKYEGRLFWVDIDDDDETFYRIVCANYWNIESPEELSWALLAANVSSRSYKFAKTYVNKANDNVWTAIDYFTKDLEAFLPSLPRMISIVKDSSDEFRKSMWDQKREAEAETKNVTIN